MTDDVAYRLAFALWVSYYAETETYDRTLPGSFSFKDNDVWLPCTDYMVDSNRFAAKAKRQLDKALGALGIDQAISERAKLKAVELPCCEHRRIAAQLNGD